MPTSVAVMGAKGRMGQAIINLAKDDQDIELAAVTEREGVQFSPEEFGCIAGNDLNDLLPKVPGAVVINFTSPEGTVEAAKHCARHGNPMVAGTTGLNSQEQEALAEQAAHTPILWAPNMSVGVNVLLKALPELVRLFGEDYDLEMVELHHNRKKDAPSGTALKIAEVLAEARGWDLEEVGNYGRHGIVGERPKKELGVQTVRGGDVVGVHTVYFMGPGERIEVTHQAHSRDTFASGALRAAKWLTGQQSGKLYSMADVFAG